MSIETLKRLLSLSSKLHHATITSFLIEASTARGGRINEPTLLAQIKKYEKIYKISYPQE